MYRLSDEGILGARLNSTGSHKLAQWRAVANAQLQGEVSRPCKECRGSHHLAYLGKDGDLVCCACNGSGQETATIEKALEIGGWK